jgi:hypothetical protein
MRPTAVGANRPWALASGFQLYLEPEDDLDAD